MNTENKYFKTEAESGSLEVVFTAILGVNVREFDPRELNDEVTPILVLLDDASRCKAEIVERKGCFTFSVSIRGKLKEGTKVTKVSKFLKERGFQVSK
jgi:hypothetical protein